jgi:hypothetical protein
VGFELAKAHITISADASSLAGAFKEVQGVFPFEAFEAGAAKAAAAADEEISKIRTLAESLRELHATEQLAALSADAVISGLIAETAALVESHTAAQLASAGIKTWASSMGAAQQAAWSLIAAQSAQTAKTDELANSVLSLAAAFNKASSAGTLDLLAQSLANAQTAEAQLTSTSIALSGALQTNDDMVMAMSDELDGLDLSVRKVELAFDEMGRTLHRTGKGVIRLKDEVRVTSTGLRQTQADMRKSSNTMQLWHSGLNQATFGVQDFIQMLSQPGMGMADALRASANNMQQVASITLPAITRSFMSAKLAATAFGAALPIIVTVLAGLTLAFVPAIAKFFEFGKAAKDARKEGEKTADFFKGLAEDLQVGIVGSEASNREKERRKLNKQLTSDLEEIENLEKDIAKIRTSRFRTSGIAPPGDEAQAFLLEISQFEKDKENKIKEAEKRIAVLRSGSNQIEARQRQLSLEEGLNGVEMLKKAWDGFYKNITKKATEAGKKIEEHIEGQKELRDELELEGRTQEQTKDIMLDRLRAQAKELGVAKEFNEAMMRRGQLADEELRELQKDRAEVFEKTAAELKKLNFRGSFAQLGEGIEDILGREQKIFEDQLKALMKIEENTKKPEAEKVRTAAAQIPTKRRLPNPNNP